MDRELFACLDRRFGELDGRLDTRFTTIDLHLFSIDARLGATDDHFQAIDAEAIDARFEAIDARFERIELEIRSTAEETRRHFDVVAEDLRWRIQVVAESVVALDERLERFRAEVGDQFAVVDRRLLRLEARMASAGSAEG